MAGRYSTRRMTGQPKPSATPGKHWFPGAFAGVFGAFLGLSLLKFGNPPIMEKWLPPPANPYEFVLGYPWPINWAYWLLALICIAGLFAARGAKLRVPLWLVALPLAWVLWQIAAAANTVDAQLTIPTLKHFIACIACFYLGLFSLSQSRPFWPFWPGLFAGFLLVVAIGCEQRFGGLAEARRYFFLYMYPQLTEI